MLTPEQIQAIKKRVNISSVESNTTQSVVDELDSAWNIPKAKVQPKTGLENIKESFKQRAETKSAIEKDYSEGKIGAGTALFQSIGNIVGGAFDIPLGIIKTMAETSPIQPTEAKKEEYKKIGENVGGFLTKITEPLANELAKPEIATRENAIKLYDKSADLLAQGNRETDPEKKKRLLELGNNMKIIADHVNNNAEDINRSIASSERSSQATIDIGTLGIGANAKPAVSEAVNLAKRTGTRLGEIATETATKAKSLVTPSAEKTIEQSLAEAQKILNPTGLYTAQEKGLAYQTGKVTTKGKGILKKEVITPESTQQTAMIDELRSQGKISSKNLPSENIKVLREEARMADAGIDDIVNRSELNKPFNSNTIEKNVFNKLENSAKENLVFVSKSTEETAYKEVMNIARQEIAKQPKNMAGLRQAIKNFNARMNEILGKDIYSESIGNARLQAAKDTRTALNRFLADNLEGTTGQVDKTLANKAVVTGEGGIPAKSTYEVGTKRAGAIYRQQLQREAMLLNAVDEIAFRSRGLINKSQLQKAIKQFPWLKSALGFVAGATGLKVLQEIGN